MQNNLVLELGVSALLIVLAVLLLNPLHMWMPDMLAMLVVVLLLGAFGILAGFVLRERATDEREQNHKLFAGRVAYLGGVAVLLLGIVVQGLHHNVDAWLVIALLVMLLAKFAAHLYSDWHL